MSRLLRPARGALIALALVLLAATPVDAAQPTRTVYPLYYPFFTIQPGSGCDFAVLGKLRVSRQMEAAAIAHRLGLTETRKPSENPAP